MVVDIIDVNIIEIYSGAVARGLGQRLGLGPAQGAHLILMQRAWTIYKELDRQITMTQSWERINILETKSHPTQDSCATLKLAAQLAALASDHLRRFFHLTHYN
jgi:hypothetical protein